MFKSGDIVKVVNHNASYIFTGMKNNKCRLVIPGLPNSVILVDKSSVSLVGPWR